MLANQGVAITGLGSLSRKSILDILENWSFNDNFFCIYPKISLAIIGAKTSLVGQAKITLFNLNQVAVLGFLPSGCKCSARLI